MKHVIVILSLFLSLNSSLGFGQIRCNNLDSIWDAISNQGTREKVDSYNNLIACYFYLGNDSAVLCADRAIQLASQIGDESRLFTAYLRKGNWYYKLGKLDSAILYLSEAKTIAIRNYDSTAMGRVSISLGSINQKTGNYYAAKNDYLLAWQHLTEENQIGNRITTARNLAMVYRNLNAIDSAFLFADTALTLLERNNLPVIKGGVYEELGRLWSLRGDHPRSMGYIKRAILLYKSVNAKFSLANAYMELGRFHFNQNEFDSALLANTIAWDLKKEVGSQSNLSQLATNLARTYQSLGDSILADQYFSTARIEAEAAADSISLALVYFNEAVTLNGEAAIELLQKSLAIYKAADPNNKQIENVAYALVYQYREIGDYKSAFFYDQEVDRLKNKAITSQESSYLLHIQSQEQQNSLLTIQSKLLQNQFKYTLIIAILVLLAISALFISRQRIIKAQLTARDERISSILQKQELAALNAMIEGQESERKRIAQDLHDRLGSMLAMVKLHFTTVTKNLDELQVKAREQYEEANTLLAQATEEVRQVAHDMTSGELVDFGLVAALNTLASSLSKSEELEVEVLAYGMQERIERVYEITLYRIIQELIGNALKHARASELTIQLIRKDNNLNITVEDNGKGFRLADAQKKEGMGLSNLEERITSLQGDFTIDSSPGNGTLITMNIPL